jgi:hypothetical protein
MSQRGRAPLSVEFSPEDAAMNDWLSDEGDYVTLERARGTVQFEGSVGLDMDEAEGA